MRDPSTPSYAYLRMEEDWHVVRTVYEGTRAMREARHRYLPQHTRETDDEYERRLQCTTLHNVLRDAVQNTAARPFRKRIALTETSPEVAQFWAEDIDLIGNSLHMFAVRAFREALLDGMVHVLVDMSIVPPGATKADEMALRTRPFWTLVPARDLIAAYSRFDEAGNKICYHARIRETVTELEDDFFEVEVERVRVYRLKPEEDEFGNPIEGGREVAVWELWERTSAGWEVIDGGPLLKAGGEPWDRVPLETFYCGNFIDDYVATPPFLDLAWKNVEHWQSSSDQRNILTKGRFPILAASGIEDPSKLLNDKGELEIGPHTALVTPHKEAKWYYVEPQGNAIKAGAEDLKQLVEDMRIMGLDPLMPQNGGMQTATERSIDESKARAPLEQWAWEFADFISRCFDRMFEWVGLGQYVGLAKVLLDIDMGLGDENKHDLQTLLQLRQLGDISRHTLYEELKRRGLLGPYFDPLREEQFIEQELMMIARTNPNFDDDSDGAGDESFLN
jgi:hypothetical protein